MRKLRLERTDLVRLVLLLILIASVAVWCEARLACTTESFERPSTGESLAPNSFKALLDNLSKQKEQRTAWAYAALAGLVGISLTKRKVLPIPWLQSSYLLLAAAALFLLESLHAADIYDRRVAYLLLRPTVTDSDLMGLSRVLLHQLNFLYTAVVTLVIFVMSFVAAIVTGKVTITDSGGE